MSAHSTAPGENGGRRIGDGVLRFGRAVSIPPGYVLRAGELEKLMREAAEADTPQGPTSIDPEQPVPRPVSRAESARREAEKRVYTVAPGCRGR